MPDRHAAPDSKMDRMTSTRRGFFSPTLPEATNNTVRKPGINNTVRKPGIILALKATAIAALTWASFSAMSMMVSQAHAADKDDNALIAYAPPVVDRFGDAFEAQPWLNAPDDDYMHPLNDAWMGMTVKTADGVAVGYVSDAFVNPDGTIDELIVTPGGDAVAHPVHVPRSQASLDAAYVKLELTVAEMRTLEPVSDDVASLYN